MEAAMENKRKKMIEMYCAKALKELFAKHFDEAFGYLKTAMNLEDEWITAVIYTWARFFGYFGKYERALEMLVVLYDLELTTEIFQYSVEILLAKKDFDLAVKIVKAFANNESEKACLLEKINQAKCAEIRELKNFGQQGSAEEFFLAANELECYGVSGIEEFFRQKISQSKKMKRWPQALAVAMENLKRFPSAKAHRDLAEVHIDMGDLAEAKKVLADSLVVYDSNENRRLLKQLPKKSENSSEILKRIYDTAEKFPQQAIREIRHFRGPKDFALLNLEAMCHVKLGNLSAAVFLAQRSLKEFRNFIAYQLLLEISMYQDDLAQAEKYLEDLENFLPQEKSSNNYLTFQLLKAQWLILSQRLPEAKELLLEDYPEDLKKTVTRLSLQIILIECGDEDFLRSRLLEYFQATNDTSFLEILFRQRLHERRNLLAKVIAEFLDNCFGEEEYLIDYYLFTGEFSLAEKVIRGIVRENPHDSEALLNLIKVLIKSDDVKKFHEAEVAATMLLGHSQCRGRVTRREVEILKGEALRKQKKFAEAIRFLKSRSCMDYKKNLCLAYCYMPLGEYLEAFRAFEKAEAALVDYEADWFDPRVRLHNGYIFLHREMTVVAKQISGTLVKSVEKKARQALAWLKQKERRHIVSTQEADYGKALRWAENVFNK